MAVIIQNMGHKKDDPKTCLYHIRINRDLIATVVHPRPEGLAALLRRAADAVDRRVLHDIAQRGFTDVLTDGLPQAQRKEGS